MNMNGTMNPMHTMHSMHPSAASHPHSHHHTASTADPHAGHGNMNGLKGMNHDMGGGMMMYFYASNKATILFKDWKTDSDGEMVGSFIALMLLAILFEGLKIMREILKKREYIRTHQSSKDMNGMTIRRPINRMISGLHFVQTILHMIQVFLGYILMLAVMTYNVWIFVAVIVGSGIGYFCFGWKRTTVLDTSDHCN